MTEDFKLPISEEYQKILDKIKVNTDEIYEDINVRLKEIMTKLEGKVPSDEDMRKYSSKVHYQSEEEYMEVLWKEVPVARIFPIKIKREKLNDDGETKFDLSMKFMDLTNE
jgi:hypothetical protein